jgi:hypothetical protein
MDDLEVVFIKAETAREALQGLCDALASAIEAYHAQRAAQPVVAAPPSPIVASAPTADLAKMREACRTLAVRASRGPERFVPVVEMLKRVAGVAKIDEVPEDLLPAIHDELQTLAQ